MNSFTGFSVVSSTLMSFSMVIVEFGGNITFLSSMIRNVIIVCVFGLFSFYYQKHDICDCLLYFV